MGGCKVTVHAWYCHGLATSAAFIAKVAVWPTAQASGAGRPQTTRDILRIEYTCKYNENPKCDLACHMPWMGLNREYAKLNSVTVQLTRKRGNRTGKLREKKPSSYKRNWQVQ